MSQPTGFASSCLIGVWLYNNVHHNYVIYCCCLHTQGFNSIIFKILFQDFHSLAVEIADNCENLVCEQKLQQKGWAAVVANLETIARYCCMADKECFLKIILCFSALFKNMQTLKFKKPHKVLVLCCRQTSSWTSQETEVYFYEFKSSWFVICDW